jgi:hypothetical protein
MLQKQQTSHAVGHQSIPILLEWEGYGCQACTQIFSTNVYPAIGVIVEQSRREAVSVNIARELCHISPMGRGAVNNEDRRLVQFLGYARLRKNSGPGMKEVPQGLKPDGFSIVYGPTKVVP